MIAGPPHLAIVLMGSVESIMCRKLISLVQVSPFVACHGVKIKRRL